MDNSHRYKRHDKTNDGISDTNTCAGNLAWITTSGHHLEDHKEHYEGCRVGTNLDSDIENIEPDDPNVIEFRDLDAAITVDNKT